MGKAKRGLLISGTVITILVSLLTLAAAGLVIWLGMNVTEEAIVEILKSAPEMYEYMENQTYQGVMYEYVFVNWETNEIILSTDVAMAANIFSILFMGLGFAVLALSAVKLILAIVALAKCGKKFAKGAVITLIVFSFLTLAIIEAILLIAALCVRSKKEDAPKENPTLTQYRV